MKKALSLLLVILTLSTLNVTAFAQTNVLTDVEPLAYDCYISDEDFNELQHVNATVYIKPLSLEKQQILLIGLLPVNGQNLPFRVSGITPKDVSITFKIKTETQSDKLN